MHEQKKVYSQNSLIAEGQYKDAAIGYEKANDLENLVRIYVTHLKKIDEAVTIVRKTKSKEGAKLISKFFQSVQDYKSVVEFCLLAGLREEALNCAKVYKMFHTSFIIKWNFMLN